LEKIRFQLYHPRDHRRFPPSLHPTLSDHPGWTVELSNNREHSFCCGTGGGLMWTEENFGRRVNHLRADEVIASGAGLAAASCPFCLTMLRDGLKDKQREDIQVKDIAQIVAEAMI
jgi:Fe-S oxidoreductase